MTQSFTNNDGHQGAWLVYLNGLEIPSADVNISYGVWMIPEATISLPPHRALQRLGAEDRIEVAIFYLDDLANPKKPEFKLMFEGDIIGWSYVNTPGGRRMNFNAIADISIFTQLYFYFMNTVDAVVGAATTKGFEANSIPQPGVFYPFSLFKKGLISTDKNPAPDINKPFDLVFNVLKGIVSNDVRPELKSYPAVNFFSRWVRKRNFINRFAALPLFEDENDTEKGVFPILKAVQADFALKTMQQNLAATVGEAGSIFDVLKQTLGLVYHELAMIPTAPCFRVRLEDGTIIGPASTTPTTPERAAKEPLRLINYFVKPQLLFGIAPTCNVIFPSMLNSLQYSENYLAQPTRTYLNDQFITGLLPQNAFTSSALTVGYPPEVNSVLKQRSGQITDGTKDVISNGKNVLVFPEEFFKGPVINRGAVPSWFTYLKNKEVAVDQEYRLTKLFELYAQYEHFRSRYEKRGGAVDLSFNPYVIPGFPCVIFDGQSSSFDVTGYLMNVTQSFSSGNMRTSISYSFGRTIQEMFDILKYDMDKLGVVLGRAPAEPVDSVRNISQNFDEAERFYNALFFGREETPGRKASFDFREVIGYLNDDESVEPIVVNGPTLRDKAIRFLGYEIDDPFVDRQTPLIPGNAIYEVKPTNNLDATKDLVPLNGFEEIFESYDAAMEYVARPVCTLSEYISFIHGGKPLSQLIQDGQVSGPNERFSYEDFNSEEYGSAVYFDRIRKLRQGPGERLSASNIGATIMSPQAGETTTKATIYPAVGEAIRRDYAQTRANWDSALEAYRLDMYNEQSPQR
jgi:hypothetical protein